MMKLINANPPVSPGTPSEKFTALNTTTYHIIVTMIGIQYIVIAKSPIERLQNQSSSGKIPPNILLIYEILILVSPMRAPTPICIKSLAIGGTLIGLLPIVSRSSTNDTRAMIIPITRMIMRRCSRRSENQAKRNTSGERSSSVMMIAIPAPYGAGSLHFSLL